jgi:hypothetical protein
MPLELTHFDNENKPPLLNDPLKIPQFVFYYSSKVPKVSLYRTAHNPNARETHKYSVVDELHSPSLSCLPLGYFTSTPYTRSP